MRVLLKKESCTLKMKGFDLCHRIYTNRSYQNSVVHKSYVI